MKMWKSILLCSIILLAGSSYGHTRWSFPPPREGEKVTDSVCDGTPGYEYATEFTAGDTVEVVLDEYKNHNKGFWKVHISHDGGITLHEIDSISDSTSGLLPHLLVIPDQPGDSVILKVIQYSKSGSPDYFSCADVRIILKDATPVLSALPAEHTIGEQKIRKVRLTISPEENAGIRIRHGKRIWDIRGRIAH